MCIRQYGTTITVSFPDNKNVIAALHILAVKAARTDRFRDFCNEITVTIFRIGMKDLRSGIIKKKGIETGTQMPVSGLPAWILNSYFISGSDIWTASSRTFRNARKALSAISWSVTPGVRTGLRDLRFRNFLPARRQDYMAVRLLQSWFSGHARQWWLFILYQCRGYGRQ